jgi:hypothetical protein
MRHRQKPDPLPMPEQLQVYLDGLVQAAKHAGGRTQDKKSGACSQAGAAPRGLRMGKGVTPAFVQGCGSYVTRAEREAATAAL